MATRAFYYRQTDSIRITVRPSFIPEHSRPELRQYVFTYRVRIENVGDRAVQLLTRRWLIHDSVGEETEVVGEGVVGLQPVIESGEVHEYSSFCVLKSGSGWMEGHYHFVDDSGDEFDAEIPRFILSQDSASLGAKE